MACPSLSLRAFVLKSALQPCGPLHQRASPRSSVLRTTPQPCKPCLPLARHRFAVCYGANRASGVATLSIFQTCQCHYPGETCRCSNRSLPDHAELPHIPEGSSLVLPVSRPGVAWLCSPLGAICFWVYFVTSITRHSRCHSEKQFMGGFCTRKESTPFHGALVNKRLCGIAWRTTHTSRIRRVYPMVATGEIRALINRLSDIRGDLGRARFRVPYWTMTTPNPVIASSRAPPTGRSKYRIAHANSIGSRLVRRH